jgi:hypothetical protein
LIGLDGYSSIGSRDDRSVRIGVDLNRDLIGWDLLGCVLFLARDEGSEPNTGRGDEQSSRVTVVMRQVRWISQIIMSGPVHQL